MGAIFGFINKKANVLNKDELNQMGELLQHRGPLHINRMYKDGMGIGYRALQYEPFMENDRDLYKQSNILHAFDGYLWNMDPLIESTIDQADSSLYSLLTALYKKNGVSYCSDLYGPYASALLDTQTQKLILSRNITGQRTLFYVNNDRFFAFASEIKALISLPGVSKEIDSDSLFWYMSSGYVPHPNTMYRSIRQLSPGGRLVYDLNSHDVSVTLADMRDGRIPQPADQPDEYYIDRLDDLLTHAVETQVSKLNGPIGCFVTGGVDTSLVASILKKVTDKKLVTFVVGYSDPSCDERPYAKKIAEILGSEHHSHLFCENDFHTLTDRIFDIHDEPFSDLGAGTALFGTTLARQYVDNVFTGAASDFLFGNFDLGHVFRFYKYTPWQIRKMMLAGSKRIFESSYVRKRFPNMPLMTYLGGKSFFETFFTKWSSEELESLLPSVVDVQDGNFYRVFQDLKGIPLSGRIQKALYLTYSTDSIDRVFERSCMANSLQTVNPYLSLDVFNFANRIPDRLKYRKGYGKYLNRRLLYERYLPQSVFKTFKRGTSLPFGREIHKPMNLLIDQYLNQDRLKKEGLFNNLNVVQNAVNAYRNGQYVKGQKLWTLIVFEMWLERASIL